MELIIDASELKDEGKSVIQGLADFMRDKTGAEVTIDSNHFTVKGESATIAKKHLRVLIKKYLYKKELKQYFRVISSDENTLKVKGRKIEED